MQEAFGGTFILKLFMVFFIIYIAFIGVALQFAKIYRIKNGAINILEQMQYQGDPRSTSDVALVKLSSYLNDIPYVLNDADQKRKAYEICNGDGGSLTEEGVCIKSMITDNTVIQKNKSNYYKVSVYHFVSLPMFSFNIPIVASGETKAIKIIS